MKKKNTYHHKIAFVLLAILFLQLNFIKISAESNAGHVTEQSQNRITYSGIVTDEDGVPISSANITISNSLIRTVSDHEGNFTIEAAPRDIIIASYLGKETVKFILPDTQVPLTICLKSTVLEYGKNTSTEDEQMPEFPGGREAFRKYLAVKIKYPKNAVKQKIEGRVIAQFVIEKDGTVSNVTIVESVSPELDSVAVKVLGDMPTWKPGRQNGNYVRVRYTVPINFNLNKKTPAQFPGGMKNYRKYFRDNLQYPEKAKQRGIQGTVFAKFTVKKNGKIENATIIEGVHPLLDNEALRFINGMPNWEPAKAKETGKVIKSRVNIKIPFKIKEGSKYIRAEFPGGMKNYRKYLIDNLQYPEEIKQKGIQGTVFAEFTVKKDGKIENVSIVESVHPLLDDEVLRFINGMPNWEPAKVKETGEIIERGVRVKIPFKIKEKEELKQRTSD